MSSMSSLLADVFQTPTAAAHSQEDLIKQADYEFFGALCRREGIDVEHLDDAKVENLFKIAMEIKAAEEGKGEHEAGETKAKEKKEEKALKEKEAAARAEYQEKRAAAVKTAEAEAMGRIMAHSFVDELSLIKSAMDDKGDKGDKGGFPFAKKEEGKSSKDSKEGKDGKGGKEEAGEKEASVARANALIAAFEQEKTASVPGSTSTPTFDEFAAWHAIDMLKHAGVDEPTAYARVNAAYTLGLPESTKMASAASEAKALEYRALEICDAAGFQVDWSQVQ